jgi:hypothetical protein
MCLFMLADCNQATVPSRRTDTTGAGSKDTTVTIGKTKLQAFQAKTGAVVVLGFSRIASVQGLYGARADVEAREFTDAATGSRTSGLSVEVHEAGTLERHETTYVDYDELESLLRGIDYIAKIDRNPTKLADFEADYRTRGDLEVSTFSNAAKTMVAVKTGNIGGATVFYPLDQLAAFRNAVAKAKAVLDSIKPAR